MALFYYLLLSSSEGNTNNKKDNSGIVLLFFKKPKKVSKLHSRTLARTHKKFDQIISLHDLPLVN